MFTADQGLAHVIEHGHYVLMLQYIAGLMGNRLAVVMNTNWCNWFSWVGCCDSILECEFPESSFSVLSIGNFILWATKWWWGVWGIVESLALIHTHSNVLVGISVYNIWGINSQRSWAGLKFKTSGGTRGANTFDSSLVEGSASYSVIALMQSPSLNSVSTAQAGKVLQCS